MNWDGLVVDWESDRMTRKERQVAEDHARLARRGSERMARLAEQEARREAREAREAAREQARAAELAAKAPTFTKRGDLWFIRGAGLEEGQTVTVMKRDAPPEDVIVDKIVDQFGDRRLATFLRIA